MDNKNKVYVDIETLLDLRQSVLHSLCTDEDDLIKYLGSTDYNFRKSDNFDIVDMNMYKKAYSNLSFENLKTATITYNINTIKNRLSNMVSSDSERPELIVNIFPLKMSPTEKKMLQNVIFVKLGISCGIVIVDMNPMSLTIDYMKNSKISSFYIYNFTTWLNFHLESLQNNKLEDVTLYFPALHKEPISEEGLEVIKKTGFSDEFSYLEFIISSKIALVFVPIVYYTNIAMSSLYIRAVSEEIIKEEMDKVHEEESEDGNSSEQEQST